ncbi:MAG: steroid 3-ketoacyl-CoA thiolase [Sulfobacillus acidophilus]|uniref:Acetyl-CoA acetyltransferase n=1 Tax=Sulfobacillus acidophilus TaxID=53633 RepID=A0A2T2WGK5_9FIRM|nr:MAG: steroid 3-ketoacyl-CoA thiolase [Sulfobacillus acidophilus]
MYEAVIIDAIRTPIGRRRGRLANVHPIDLLAGVLGTIVQRNHLSPELVDDVIVGCVDQAGDQAVNIARNAWLSAGLPESVPAVTIDRQCGSSLQALHFAAQGIMAGAYDVAIAAGVESMSRVPMMSTVEGHGFPMTEALHKRYQLERYGRQFFDQALGAELVAQQWRLTREDLDRFSLESHRRAHAAQQRGQFDAEIVGVRLPDGEVFERDEGIRPDTSLEKMLGLPPAFADLKLITAGNASQISDGASAALVVRRDLAEQWGMRPRARFVSFAVVGVNPVTMLTGPIPASRKALERAGLRIDQIDLAEVNEAFASVVLAWQRELGMSWDRVNVHGGAVALGHPLGATGTRLVATLLNALEIRQGRYGLIAICEGGGMANSVILERLE